MVCQCKPASAKGISCSHEDCLNGMLNIECITGFCESGKECRNQRFQRRQYAKSEIRRAGLKGFGLFALEHIKKGAFIIEYVGEVLDEEEYLRRKEYYHSVGQRHYYFMNIGNGEVSVSHTSHRALVQTLVQRLVQRPSAAPCVTRTSRKRAPCAGGGRVPQRQPGALHQPQLRAKLRDAEVDGEGRAQDWVFRDQGYSRGRRAAVRLQFRALRRQAHKVSLCRRHVPRIHRRQQ
jgi:hypothetical protein